MSCEPSDCLGLRHGHIAKCGCVPCEVPRFKRVLVDNMQTTKAGPCKVHRNGAANCAGADQDNPPVCKPPGLRGAV